VFFFIIDHNNHDAKLCSTGSAVSVDMYFRVRCCGGERGAEGRKDDTRRQFARHPECSQANAPFQTLITTELNIAKDIVLTDEDIDLISLIARESYNALAVRACDSHFRQIV
jgi:hypothetical protein